MQGLKELPVWGRRGSARKDIRAHLHPRTTTVAASARHQHLDHIPCQKGGFEATSSKFEGKLHSEDEIQISCFWPAGANVG
jgi:hypothetical protein